MTQINTSLFREAFVGVLLDELPSWREYVLERAQDGRLIEITPPNWKGPPFTISIRGDTVTVCPLCTFGFDYISTATETDLKREPQRVFAKPVSEIAKFVGGQTVVAIKRNTFFFLKLGWDVRFIPVANAQDARHKGCSVVAWPKTVRH